MCVLAGDNNKKFTAVANSLLNISKVKSFFIKNLITNYVCDVHALNTLNLFFLLHTFSRLTRDLYKIYEVFERKR